MQFFCCESQILDQYQFQYAVDLSLYNLIPARQNIKKQIIEKLSNQGKKIKNLIVQEQNAKKISQRIYLVSTKWFQRWKVYVGYDNNYQYVGCGKLPILNEDIIERENLIVQFLQPFSHWNIVLKANLAQGTDVLFFSERIWNQLKQFPKKNIEIIRQIREINGKESTIQINFLKCKLIIVSDSYLKGFLNKKQSENKKLPEGFIHISNYQEAMIVFSELSKAIIKKWDLSFAVGKQKIKFWKLNNSIEADNYLANIKIIGERFKKPYYKFQFPGQKILPKRYQIKDLEIRDNSTIFVEILEEKSEWIFYNEENIIVNFCDACQIKKQLRFYCICRAKFYCSEQCRQKNKIKHEKECIYKCENQEQQKNDMILVYKQFSKRGLTGLKNLGNTCYLNSALQCLSSYKQLIEFFLKNSYQQFINKENPLGTKGRLINSFASIVKKMYYGENKIISPFSLKTQMGKYNYSFAGYNQQDASQFLSFLLDVINEDLNQIVQKPYVQQPDYNPSRSDREVAQEYWNNFRKRNKSIITELFYGQFKSRLDCSNCKYYSLSFDPFSILSLPIFNEQIVRVKVKIIKLLYQANQQIQIQFVRKKKFKVNYLIQKISEFYKHINSQLLVYYSKDDFKVIDSNLDLEELIDKHRSSSKILYCRFLQQEEQVSSNSIYMGVYHSLQNKSFQGKSILTDMIVFSFNKNRSCEQIYNFFQKNYGRFRQLNKNEYALKIKTNASFIIQSCYFCNNTSCNNCILPKKYKINWLQDQIIEKSFNLRIQIEWAQPSQMLKILYQSIKYQEKQASVQTIENCLNLFSLPEILGQQNMWYCKNCKCQVRATKKIEIYKSPKYLIVVFKRFKDEGKAFRTKITIPIQFPFQNFNFTRYVVEKQSNKQIVYNLKAICNHYGSLVGGHYTAFAKNWYDNEWYEFDDGNVKKVSAESINKSQAYLLFYQRQ